LALSEVLSLSQGHLISTEKAFKKKKKNS